MEKSYVACPTCHHIQMQLLGKSHEVFGDPPTEAEHYYHCPNCKAEWTHDQERNALAPQVPPEFSQNPQ